MQDVQASMKTIVRGTRKRGIYKKDKMREMGQRREVVCEGIPLNNPGKLAVFYNSRHPFFDSSESLSLPLSTPERRHLSALLDFPSDTKIELH